MATLHLSLLFLGRPIFVLSTKISRPIFKSAVIRRLAYIRGNTVLQIIIIICKIFNSHGMVNIPSIKYGKLTSTKLLSVYQSYHKKRLDDILKSE